MKKQICSAIRRQTYAWARPAAALLLLTLSWLTPAGALTAAPGASDEGPRDAREQDDGNIKAKGAFTCDFALPADFPFGRVAPVIERDRMYMAERPGMQRKQIPLRFDFESGRLLTGGRYLFDTEQDAKKYKAWVENDFVLDGTRFFDRPYFLDPDCHCWGVVAAHNIKDIGRQVVMRTERWSVPEGGQSETLKRGWPTILEEAEGRGLAGVWLLYNKQERLAQLVYFADRVARPDPAAPDFQSLAALEFAPPLGAAFDGREGWAKTFDRTQWVLTVWSPFLPGDRGEPSLWPNSPPLAEPYVGDGVCEVSRGEDNANAPGDCGPLCGNGVCDLGEETQNCPGDCRLP